MTRGNGGLQRVRTACAAEFLRTLQRSEAAGDQQLIPSRTVLIEQQNRLSCEAHAGGGAGSLNLHERDEPVNLWFSGSQLRENSAETKRFLAQRGAHQVIAGSCGVALVEDEVDDFEHRRQAFG